MNGVSGHSAVSAMRRTKLAAPTPAQKHELFPTPPWAVRALFEHVMPIVYGADRDCGVLWDPCAGLGHMSETLKEYSDRVCSTDITHFDLDGGGRTESLGIGLFDFLNGNTQIKADWIITNPPFATAERFLEPALRSARCGVAFLERLQWLETTGRYERVFTRRPPLVAAFAERVPLCEGGYDPKGSTATAYAWFVWAKNCHGLLRRRLGPGDTLQTFLIPPGCAKSLFKPSDIELAKRCVPGFIPPSQKKKLRELA
jgi:hypothetical protein